MRGTYSNYQDGLVDSAPVRSMEMRGTYSELCIDLKTMLPVRSMEMRGTYSIPPSGANAAEASKEH